MKIAILGGTGKMGMAFAARLVRTPHELMIGSRDAASAEAAGRGIDARVQGKSNIESARWCDLALVAVPYAGHRVLIELLKQELSNKIVIDTTVPIDPANLFQIKTEFGKSAAEETASIVPAAVFAAFQTVSHRVLRRVDMSHDVLVAGPAEHKTEVMDLIRAMLLHPIDAGPLEVAGHIERATVLLLSINKANKVKESGLKIEGL
jgi:hypothetical protein